MRTVLSLFLVLLCITSGMAQELDTYLQAAKFRNIGPFRGGRANGGSGVVGDPSTYYMGTTGGGVWKTDDAGNTWNNISDGYFNTGSVGAVSVSESHPNVVYVGMGEHAPRGVMTSYGDGVYKSTDAGKTWTHLGLKETRHISRIVIHPNKPDIVWVAAQGALHGPNKERGIYKTTDGGETWKQVLFVNELTGCSELSVDISNPQVLYAAMWEHIRKPWQVVSGGEGSGLYKSTDGGETWFKIENGIPEEKGKMAIAVSRANPDRVYALVESDSKAEKGGLFVSDNAGESWSRVSDDHRLIQRAWYYIEVFPDTKDENTLYVLSASFYKSIDGGKTWEEINTHHGDYHDLWINPDNPKNMMVTDDGGSTITLNGGRSWSSQQNMPTAQIYRVATDNLFPYNLYGGQQDNTSVKIASIGLGDGSIGTDDWSPSAGGESAFLAFDPDNPTKVMGGSYLGTIELLNTEAKASTNVMIEPNLYLGLPARDMKYLYNWNAPIIKSVHEPDAWYHCAQYVLRSRDEGKSWEVISPDLTTNDDSKQGNGGGPYTNEAVGAENYGTISYIIESPHEKGVFYTGSDDGMVYVTKDNGETWNNITPKKLPETLVNAIEVSPHDPATVYIATTRYKFNDHTPGLWKSTNYGKTWTNISEGIPVGAYTRVVREDPVRKGLLVAGTELGLYISFNGGATWEPFKNNLPVVPVTDLLLEHDDLIVATQGRSFWIFDDLHLLRAYEAGSKGLNLYTPEPAILANWYSGMNSNDASGTGTYEGVNPASGMPIYYHLPQASEDTPVILEIRNEAGKLVRTISSEADENYRSYEGAPSPKPVLPKSSGLNRFVWDMRHEMLPGAPEVYIEGSFRGHKAIPGNYTITLRAGDAAVETKAVIKNNPLFPTTAEDYKEYEEFMSKAEATYTEMTNITNRNYDMLEQLRGFMKRVDKKKHAEAYTKAEALAAKMDAFDKLMVQRLSKAYDDVENYVNGFTAHYLTAINQTDSQIPRVNKGNKDRIAELNAQWQEHKKLLDEISASSEEVMKTIFALSLAGY
ncbi:WD40/YVTN/BNR-like repeat-containing protein [Robertkochia sediminum]|uniref:WD40/YVTN/BNR-like repeat-containing protein n=1 Tax=Robertkochia sediminum TaxID=2785326 RepID=UPI0019335B4D|nr:glycosyl hydrolase [Robertkochia sediminum]MBL7471272.1 glycosyl hydrolase [Robertkochia sediminum]